MSLVVLRIMGLALALFAAPAPAAIAREAWRLEVEPTSPVLGQPLEVTALLEVPLDLADAPDALGAEREVRTALRARAEELAFDEELLEPAWVVLDEGPILIERSGVEGSPGLVVRRTWSLVLLEAGEADLPLPWTGEELGAAGARIEVAGLLGEGEDAPRPGPGFLELPDLAVEAEESALRTWLPLTGVLGGSLALAILGLVARRRRRARDTGPTGPTPAERLAALAPLAEPTAGAAERELCEAHFELTAALRAGLDARRPDRARVGLTDAEWAAALPADLAEAAELLRDCAPIKYAGEPASPWALGERLERARALLARGGSA